MASLTEAEFGLHPWAEGVQRCLAHEGLESDYVDAYRTVLHRILTDHTPGEYNPQNYDHHQPRRRALAKRLATEGFPKSAALVWHEDEDEAAMTDHWARGLVQLRYARPLQRGASHV